MYKLIAPTNYILVTDSASEPLTLSEVKIFLRIDSDDYDGILTPLITTVRQLAERITGRDMINKTWKCYLDNDCNNLLYPNYYNGINSCVGIEILKSKLQSITSIQYYSNDVLTTWSSSNYYITDEQDYSSINLVDGGSFPSDIDNRKQAVVITFVSGYGADASFVPQALKEAMLYHISALFENSKWDRDWETSLHQLD